MKEEQKKKEEKPREKLRILAAGDFHGDSKVAKRLAEKAEKEKVDLVILTGDLTGLIQTRNLIKPFTDRKQKVLFVPGNWETKEDAETLARMYGIKNIEEKYAIYKGVGIMGIGAADWTLFPDNERTFQKMKKDDEKIKNLEKKIIISHLHAAGTKSELSGFPGVYSLRKAIEEFKPDLFISGHIHELEGVEERIGKTRVLNIGKKGKIIEL